MVLPRRRKVRREGFLANPETPKGEHMADQKDLLAALVEFSDTLVRDHDVVEFLQRLTTRCVDLVDPSEAGIILADRDCTLQHVVASNDRTSLLALEQLRHDEGPSLDSY